MSFSPLGKGFLTGTIDETTQFVDGDFRNIVPRFIANEGKANQELVVSISAIATAKGVTSAQVAPSPGSWRKSRGSSPSPAPPRATA